MNLKQLPQEFLERMERMLGEEYPAFLQSYEEPRKFGLRVNTMKISVEEFQGLAPFHLTPIPWIPNGFYYEREDDPARHPFYYAGLYYLQEPSAMTPASILPVTPGEHVLDLCAAPGGKATALGAKLKGRGLLVANDISASRAKALLKNLEIFGIRNSFVTNAYPVKLAEQFAGAFDKILVDAPCSGEGMFRKDLANARVWSMQKVEECTRAQHEIIRQAVSMLRPGGLLLYSTCTFSPEENEQTVASLLQEYPEMRLVEIPWYEGFAHGRPELADGNAELTKCVRIFPHRMAGEGHFLALLYKKKDGEADAELRLSEVVETQQKDSSIMSSERACTEVMQEKAVRTNSGQAKVQLPDPVSVENMQMETDKNSLEIVISQESITTLHQNIYDENFVEQSEHESQDISKKRKRKSRDVNNLNLNGKARGKDKNCARERLTSGGKKSGLGKAVHTSSTQSDAAVLEEFLQDIAPVAGYTLADMDIHNGQVYYIRNRVPAGRGIPFLRNGLYFGELRKGRFEPSQSLAMALRASDYASVLDFQQADERVRRYLGGETVDVEDLPCARKKGWQLVCVDGYPLGWGKLVNGTLKNKYHPGWRMTV